MNLEYKKVRLLCFIWPMCIASIPGYWSYKVITYEMKGIIIDAQHDCMSVGRCSSEYKVKVYKEDVRDASYIIADVKVGKGKGGWYWPLDLKPADIIKKEKWSAKFCVNDQCKNKSVVGNIIFSLVLYVIVGWWIRVDVLREHKKQA